MKKMGVFLDVNNLYYCVGKKFEKRKLDYRKYLEFVTDFGTPVLSIAYGTQLNNEAAKFIHSLEKTGFTARFRTVKRWHEDPQRSSWDVGITVDAVNALPETDLYILGSGSGSMVPLVELLRGSGKEVFIVACGINKDLKAAASEFFEIPESLLEVR